MKVVVCGEGNAVHVMMAQIGSVPDVQLSVFGMLQGEHLKAELAKNSNQVVCHNPDGSSTTGTVKEVSLDPAHVIPGADLVLIPLPVFAHRPFLEAIRDHVSPATAIGLLPGQGGSQWLAKKIFGDKFRDVTLFGTDKLPYNARIEEFGKSVRLFGLKTELGCASIPKDKDAHCAQLISKALAGFVTGKPKGEMLHVTLMPVNQCIHPSRMYSLFHDWDGKTPYENNPLFYEEMSEEAVKIMQGVDDDIQNVAAGVDRALGASLEVPRIHPMLVSWYDSDLIGDASSLLSYFRTNKGYAGIGTPMVQVDGGWFPDYKSRYFSEDIPFGLCVTRGVATMVGVATPTVDMLILWAQNIMQKEYLKDGEFCGKDVGETFAPQAFGFHDVQELL
ncbi:Tauropine dehydrogenase [Porphyridium purpureum]|uniref:Tauropine dehydrogenase n=1 Tax=Porphyridium purpureum TaxID=35688 RepID=A0A5J4YJE6_PORPP|nr:Tauropine dehydrogenase [Porphyridium purpureum]|eukprot:POR5385..scf251_18